MKTGNYLTGLALIILTGCTAVNQSFISPPSPEPILPQTGPLPKEEQNILFPVLSKDKINGEQLWGYIDSTGKIVIKHQFIWAYPFFEGIAVVSLDGKDGYIDLTGTLIIKPLFVNSTALAICFI